MTDKEKARQTSQNCRYPGIVLGIFVEIYGLFENPPKNNEPRAELPGVSTQTV